MSHKALLVFVDGIGMGRRGAQNPFDGAPLDVLEPLADVSAEGFPNTVYGSIDATLGHPGLPQSATGQAVILTGEDAIAVQSGHFSGHPTPRLARLISEKSVLLAARQRGRRVGFLNAYDDARAAHLERVVRGEERASRRRPASASTWAALAGGGSLRTLRDVEAGRAATFDLTGETLRAFGVAAPRRTVREAAESVAHGAMEVDLSLFEIFTTDMAGHSQDTTWARAEATKLDRFLSFLFQAAERDPELLVVVTSDHGNLEDLSTRTHTRASVPLLAHGTDAAEFVRGARDLRDVAPRLLERVSPAKRDER